MNSTSKRQELEYRIRAISRALDSWNDLEALRLLRLSWKDIERTLREQMRNRDRKLRRILLASTGTGNGQEAAANPQQEQNGPLVRHLLGEHARSSPRPARRTSEPSIMHADRPRAPHPVSAPSVVSD